MKTKNYLEAFGTINLTLAIIGLCFSQIMFIPNMESTSQKLSEVSLREFEMLIEYIVANFSKAFLCLIGMLGAMNGMFSFFVRFDWKSLH